MSMRNELRGQRQNTADWYKYMQQGADAIHKENPDFLVIVSGLSFDTNLGFLKTRQLGSNLNNKLVFEAHWYSFGISAEKWEAQTNQLCASVTKTAKDNYLFLTTGKNAFPLVLSEFGPDQRGVNEADNRYISCLLAAVAESDIDWALWTFQGSYMLREGRVNTGEAYGVMDLNWDKPQNPSFLDRLQIIRQKNQGIIFCFYIYKFLIKKRLLILFSLYMSLIRVEVKPWDLLHAIPPSKWEMCTSWQGKRFPRKLQNGEQVGPTPRRWSDQVGRKSAVPDGGRRWCCGPCFG